MTGTAVEANVPLPQRDVEHLRMLVIGHYALAAIQAMFGCFPIIHLVMGALIVTGRMGGKPGHSDPVWVGWFFIAMAVTLILTFWTLAIALVLGARRLQARRGYVFCMVVAFFAAIFNMPLGTALGACTLIVLLRPSVKAAFEANG